MKHLITAALISLALVLPAKANDDIERVISAQIEAFLADDFETAFTFASPTIKDIFGNSDRFGEMVRKGYPMVWRPQEVDFLSIEERGSELWQNVMIRDATDALFLLEYQMIENDDGWKINAVKVRKAGDGTA